MKKRQKLILIIYFYAVLCIGFLYVPYTQHFSNGIMRFAGHRLRFKLWELTPWQPTYTQNLTIDANLIIAELLAITAMTVVIFLFLKRD